MDACLGDDGVVDESTINSVAARWVRFPAGATPRPVVLADRAVRLEGVFLDDEFERAWTQGLIRPDPSLPGGVAARLSTGTAPSGGSTLTVSDAAATTATFRCDRGLRELPAYRMEVTGLRGACLVLSPEVECWWPADETEARRGTGGVGTVDDDGATLHLMALGGPLTAAQLLEFHEEDAFVVVRAVSVVAPGSPAPRGAAKRVALTGRLRAPLGGRVLVDTTGRPVVVTGG